MKKTALILCFFAVMLLMLPVVIFMQRNRSTAYTPIVPICDEYTDTPNTLTYALENATVLYEREGFRIIEIDGIKYFEAFGEMLPGNRPEEEITELLILIAEIFHHYPYLMGNPTVEAIHSWYNTAEQMLYVYLQAYTDEMKDQVTALLLAHANDEQEPHLWRVMFAPSTEPPLLSRQDRDFYRMWRDWPMAVRPLHTSGEQSYPDVLCS